MYVTATAPPASAPGGYVWEDEHAVVHVPDDLGTDLLRIAGQFTEVLPGDDRHPGLDAPVPPPPSGELEPVEDDLIGEVAEQCTAAKSDGTPCKAKPRPGQSTCSWHSEK